MKKKSNGYTILILGIISIFIVTFVNFNKNEINKYIYKSFNKNKFVIPKINEYYNDLNYEFIANYTDDINNKEELLNYIYYVINSGSTYANGQCSDKYLNCYEDLKKIANDTDLLSNLNNFVSPYNSFKVITFENNLYGTFNIKIKHTYGEKEISEINKFINEFINKYINSKMSTYDKIKAVHDYIIENTDYDSNIKDSSKTAYGVIKYNEGICSGYADTVSLILNNLGIKNYRINSKDHIWNLVYVNGKWLHLDVTWDDPISEEPNLNYTYFLITSNELKNLKDNTHEFDNNIFKEANSN